MTEPNQPAPAYSHVQQENDPGLGTEVAEEAPAEPGTVADPGVGGRDGSGGHLPAQTRSTGFPSGSTNTPPAEDSAGTPAPTDTDDPDDSGRAGGAPAIWPANDGHGVAGTKPGDADLDTWGGTGLTTRDTEETT